MSEVNGKSAPCRVCGARAGKEIYYKGKWRGVGITGMYWMKDVCDDCGHRVKPPFRPGGDTDWLAQRALPRICDRCKAPYWYPIAGPEHVICPDCHDRMRTCGECGKGFESDKPAAFCSSRCEWASEAAEWWNTVVPALYRDHDPKRLPMPAKTEGLLNWGSDNEKPGAFVYGTTGAGKTRSAFLLLKRFVSYGYTVRYMRGSEFQKGLIDRTKPGGIGGFSAWIEELQEVDVLLIDEAEKVKFSERTQAEFFDLVETRLASERIVVLISNLKLDDLAGKMDPEYAAPFARRVRELFDPFFFVEAPKSTGKARRAVGAAPTTTPVTATDAEGHGIKQRRSWGNCAQRRGAS